MIKKFNDILSDLKAGTYAPIYILCGEETYYTDRVYEFIAANALDEMAREFDQQVLYGRDLPGADIAPVISAVRGYAMMGGRKVVIVREAQAIKKWDALDAYLNNMMPQNILVICYNGKPDKRQNVWKHVMDHPQVVWLQSDKLRDFEVEKWIAAYIADIKKRTSRIDDRPACSTGPGRSYRYRSLGNRRGDQQTHRRPSRRCQHHRCCTRGAQYRYLQGL